MALTKVKAGNIILTTPSASSNDVTPATTQYVTTAIGNLIDTAPSTLNTLNELAAALGDDVNFSTTVTNSIATKLPLAGGTMTGALTSNSLIKTTGDLEIASTQPRLILDRSDGSYTWNIYNGDGSGNFPQSTFNIANNAGTSVLTALDSGNVGIGTATPATRLHVVGGRASGTMYDTAVFAGGQNSTSGSGARLYISGCENDPLARGTIIEGKMTDNGNSHELNFYTSGNSQAPTKRLTIDNSGNVGIGQPVPTSLLEVKGANGANGIKLTSPSGLGSALNINGSGYGEFYLYQAGGNPKVGLQANGTSYFLGGNVGIGTASPNGTGFDGNATVLSVNGYYRGIIELGSNNNVIGDMIGGIEFRNTASTEAYVRAYRDSNGDSEMRLAAHHFNFTSGNVGIGGSTITDANLLNIQGSGASKNIGVVFNDTNTSKIFSIQNGGSALKFFDYTASAERMRITADGVVSAPIASTHGGMLHGAHTPNPAASYLGSNGADFGTIAIYRTPVIESSASTAATSQFLSIYSSGHWGEYPVFRFKVYSTYFVAGYREYVGHLMASNASLVEVELNGTTSFIGSGGNNTITMSSVVSSGLAANSGQPRYRRDFTLTSHGNYGRCYVVVEIMYGGNRYYGSNTTTADLDADGDSAGSYHFKTMSLAQGQGTFSTT